MRLAGPALRVGARAVSLGLISRSSTCARSPGHTCAGARRITRSLRPSNGETVTPTVRGLAAALGGDPDGRRSPLHGRPRQVLTHSRPSGVQVKLATHGAAHAFTLPAGQLRASTRHRERGYSVSDGERSRASSAWTPRRDATGATVAAYTSRTSAADCPRPAARGRRRDGPGGTTVSRQLGRRTSGVTMTRRRRARERAPRGETGLSEPYDTSELAVLIEVVSSLRTADGSHSSSPSSVCSASLTAVPSRVHVYSQTEVKSRKEARPVDGARIADFSWVGAALPDQSPSRPRRRGHKTSPGAPDVRRCPFATACPGRTERLLSDRKSSKRSICLDLRDRAREPR